MKDILSLSLRELESLAIALGEPQYRGAQVYAWLHKQCCGDFSMMGNIPLKFREALAKKMEIAKADITDTIVSADGAKKYAVTLIDGCVETVFLPRDYGNALCVSTQMGCAYACVFCACKKFTRNLTAGEMLRQVYLAGKKDRISSVVVMGTGEPLANLDNLLLFIARITECGGRNLSSRNITVSTVGIESQIYKLADADTGVNLAISLHAADDVLRKRLMPNVRASIRDIIDAADYFFARTGRRVTYEYMPLSGVNDSNADIDALAALLRHRNVHVNLIPYNENGTGFEKSKRIKYFSVFLRKNGIKTTIRHSLGEDIFGACGMLTSKQG